MSVSDNDIKAIHSGPASGVFVIAGGGLAMLDRLLRVPGASGTVLEGLVPYAEKSMETFLGFRPEKSCSDLTARQLAMAAYRRALDYGGTLGFAMTSALTTNREKKGTCRTHIAYQDCDITRVWNYDLSSAHSRIVHEAIVSEHGIHTFAEALKQPRKKHRFRDLMSGKDSILRPPREIRAILPGSFNPIHEGHVRMRKDAEDRLQTKVFLELCINNADKGYVDYIDLKERQMKINNDCCIFDDVVYTNTPLFIDKARALGEDLIFVVGIDTMMRIADPKYYGGEQEMTSMFEELKELKCRFLVYGRMVDDKFLTLWDVNLPPKLERLCKGVYENHFRFDASSTDIRSSNA